jgi:hypothetical protein
MAHIKKATEKWEAKPRSERNPVEAFPSELMLFFRTVFLLRGLCTSLEVRVKYLKIMGAWAKRSMLESHVAGPLGSPSQSPPRGPKNSLDARVAACLAAHASVLVGAQVVAIKGRAEACNVAVGCVHDLDARRVSRDTLFPCLGLAQGVAQMAALQACREAGLGLDTPVAKVWPAFRDRVLSIGALLSGDTGLLAFAPSALPEVFFVQSMHKTAPLLRFVERISGGPAHGDAAAAGLGESEQGDKVLPWELSTLAFAWGAAVAGLVQALDKGSEDAFARRVAALWPGVLARVPDQDVPAPPPAKTLPEAERARAEAVRRDERERVSGKYASICLDVESLFGGAVDLDKMWEAGASLRALGLTLAGWAQGRAEELERPRRRRVAGGRGASLTRARCSSLCPRSRAASTLWTRASSTTGPRACPSRRRAICCAARPASRGCSPATRPPFPRTCPRTCSGRGWG